MNTTALHPVVLEKLRRFSRQRRRLILWRGLCSIVAVWLAAMTALALLDRLVLVEDGVRMALSLLAYAGTAVVVWRTCVRYLAHLPGPRELARLVEVAAPQLREQLLAAVELADSGQKPHWDSDELRAAIQQIVARDVGRIQVESLITRRLIAAWLYAAGATIVVFLALFNAPGLHFRQAFARAALPAANIPRYSSIQIEVLAPAPADQTVPEGDAVPVTVRVTGGDVRRVVLETFPKRGPRERAPMALSAVNQFTAPVQVNQSPVLYRVRARDAVTQKFTLNPHPRPQVLRFHKTYHYPSYTRLAARAATEDNGDLDALDGTEVELKLDVDQPMQRAALRLDLGKAAKEIPLQQLPNGQLAARVPLTAAGTYRVQLVAAQTGFENKYSPQYEIRVQPDLLPSVKIEQPEQDQIVLPPDALVQLTGAAKDDIALSNIEQAIQVNHGSWQTFPLQQPTGVVATVARTWDLFELGVHPGDRVITKLVATDLKGQRGESVPLRIMIAAPGFDPQRHARLKAKQSVEKSLQELRDATDKLDRAMTSAKTAIASRTADKLQKQQALLAARAAAEDAAEKAADTLRRIQDTLPRMASVRESGDLVLVGAAVSRALREGIEPLKAALERAATGDDMTAKTGLQKAQESLNAAVSPPRVANDNYRQMVAADQARAITSDLAQINADQRALSEMFRDPLQTERATRRQTVTADQAKEVEQQLKRLAQQTRDWPANTARETAQHLAGDRDQVEKTLAAEPTAERLKPVADAMQRGIEKAAAQMQKAERELASRAEVARQRLAEQFSSSANSIAKLIRQKTPVIEQMEMAASHLKDRAALEEKRPHPDAQFASDAARAADAVQALADAASPTNALAAIKAIEQAYRKLETGHHLGEQVSALRQLAAQERWERLMSAEAVERAKDWKWSHEQMKSLPQQLQQAQLPAEAAKSLNATADSPSVRQIADEMRQRQESAAPTMNVAQPVAQVANDVAEVKRQIQPYLDEARAEIEKAAPKLSERLAGLAKNADNMQGKTDEQARHAGQPDMAEKIRAEAKNLSHDQQKLDNRVNDARNAIRRDANVQNLATEEGRQRARDADDASAMLREPSPSANDMLQHAAHTPQPDHQKNALKGAAELQGKLADTLRQLAEHYKNLEAGQPGLTRMALREAEKEMGLKPTLDAEYAKAMALEELAGLTPLEQLQELEKALQQNKPMRAELSEIARNTLQNAAADLQRSANKEQHLAQHATSPAEAAAQQPRIEQNVRDAGNDIERAGRHESRLGNQTMGQEVQQLGNQIENKTGGEVAKAGKEMAQSQSSAQAQAAARAAGDAIQQATDQVNAMLQQPMPSPASPASMESMAGKLAAAEGAAAQWMARALDSLDAAMNLSTQASQSGQQAQQTQAGQGQTQGQSEQAQGQTAASQAAQAQASSMMSARGQGLTPGQQPMSEKEGSGAGAAFRAQGLDVGNLPESLRRLRGEWGKLPPKLARDLMESPHEGVAGEYREMVELYFRAIAIKAQEGK
ncbi:MAG: hypothetical protein FJ395_02705 [Verrucomicrobia bacterium]|nr:hypothetical protein [Verrucomicrobiota bacterium]